MSFFLTALVLATIVGCARHRMLTDSPTTRSA